jgi:hypothetical protein
MAGSVFDIINKEARALILPPITPLPFHIASDTVSPKPSTQRLSPPAQQNARLAS